MLTPVRPSTTFGILSTTSRTSVVNLAAPMSPLPIDTMVTFLVCDSGAATSAATCSTEHQGFFTSNNYAKKVPRLFAPCQLDNDNILDRCHLHAAETRNSCHA